MKDILYGKKYLYFVAIYISDVLMFIMSVLIANLLVMGHLMDVSTFSKVYIFIALILLVNYSNYGMYKDRRSLFDGNSFMDIVYSVFTTYILFLATAYIFELSNLEMHILTFVTMLLCIIFTAIARITLANMVYIFRRKGYDIKRVMFYGESTELANKVMENSSLGYKVVYVTKNFAEMKKYLDKVDIVFIKKDVIDEKLLGTIIEHDEVDWKIISSAFNLVIDPVAFDEFRDYPILNVRKSQKHDLYTVVKRLMDVSISGVALLILSPLFLFVAIIIKLTMPGPVFFRHERIGLNMKPFQIMKFRSMVVDAEARKKKMKNEVKGLFKKKDDPRVTPFGKFLRRTCIDELPQLINIFKGDMSIVGPRPHLRNELPFFKGWRKERFKVKPGLTGLWQVSGRHEVNFDKAVLYDIYYMKNRSILQDIIIIMKTIPAIIFTRGRY